MRDWHAQRWHLLRLAERVCVCALRGKASLASSLRKSLVARLSAVLREDTHNVEAWLMLGDARRWTRKRIESYRRAVKLEPWQPEAHAELAQLYAGLGKPAYALHCDLALSHCKGYDIEDHVIWTVMEAANVAKDAARARRAQRLGRRRFPESRLFQD
jgi:hypothetical protein